MQYSQVKLQNYDWQDENIAILIKDEDKELNFLEENLRTEFKSLLEDYELKSDETKVIDFLTSREGKKHRFFLVKLQEGPHIQVRRKAMRELECKLRERKVEDLALVIGSKFCAKGLSSLLNQLDLATYRFDMHLGHGGPNPNPNNELPEKPETHVLSNLKLVLSSEIENQEVVIDEAFKLAEAVKLSRYLVDQPANLMTPEILAEEAKKAAEKYGFEIEIKEKDEIIDMGMEAFWAVAKGSDNPPRFIVMRYLNNPDSDEKIALVGKGICYDSGGYAIKPASGMVTMHADMGGSAAVIGAISALAACQEKVNVVAIVAACENMISGDANRNGDIIGSLAGKTIEVLNTDAEGRLTLADAVTYAQKFEKATKIIDIATLTGACVVALGTDIAGVISNDDEIFNAIQLGSDLSGDKVWRMPNDDEYALLNKSRRADISNTGSSRWGGMITAGLFVRAFTGGLPWAHIDIAGPAYLDGPTEGYPAGASGAGAAILYHATKELCK
ncbi:MAG: leucyl aminopeptidase [Eubacteriales bacterium]|nr:leucyl aminopeptidase [Eubacteriales bacterium]